MKHLFPLFLVVIFIGCNGSGGPRNTVWMTRNLDVTTYRNGDPIPQVTDPEQWKNLTTGAWCYYNNNPANNATYGKLYNWYAVNDPRGLAPAGYHIPTYAEFQNYCAETGGGLMKESGTTHWAAPNTGASNRLVWTGLPGGQRAMPSLKMEFIDSANYGYWWSTSEGGPGTSSSVAYFKQLAFDNNYFQGSTVPKNSGLSVRCIEN